MTLICIKYDMSHVSDLDLAAFRCRSMRWMGGGMRGMLSDFHFIMVESVIGFGRSNFSLALVMMLENQVL